MYCYISVFILENNKHIKVCKHFCMVLLANHCVIAVGTGQGKSINLSDALMTGGNSSHYQS